MHWNNPQLLSNVMDSSGLTIYYTSHLRPNDGGVVEVYQLKLNIPPHRTSVFEQATCSSYCTSALPHSVYITQTLLHMHMLGTKCINLGPGNFTSALNIACR
jgi:Copper type II ascorbate-dependent monooxygenase, C-terminal domain